MKRVEILYFDDCANWQDTLADVEGTVRELGVEADVVAVRVGDAAQAQRLRFLGSPTVRVDGRDVEPGAAERHDYVLACRVYRTEAGLVGRPPVGWLKAALSP